MRRILFFCALMVSVTTAVFAEEAYTVAPVIPDERAYMEVGGLDVDRNGTVYACTRRGDVWTFKDGASWRLFARGLHEPLGLLCGDDGEIFVIQRPELSHIIDENGDGKADRFETICNSWHYSGNYHEYGIGLARDQEGSFYFNLGLSLHPRSQGEFGKEGADWLGGDKNDRGPFRGWHAKVTNDGTFVPIASGIRAPNGLGKSPEGEIFITDNQGSFVPSGALYLPRPGQFFGHPDALRWDPKRDSWIDGLKAIPYDQRISKLDAMRARPVFYIPYPAMGNSCSQPTWDTTGGAFGPYAGQVFIGDVQIPLIMRGTYEDVGGSYQGACYPFIRRSELGGGSNRILFTGEGRMLVGQTARGWGQGIGLKQISWNKIVPMELKEVTLTANGFNLGFTKPLDPTPAVNSANYTVTRTKMQYTNVYRATNNSQGIPVTKAIVAKDGKTVWITVDGLVADHVYKIDCSSLTATSGEKVEFGYAYYTANRLR
jgi:hypothetical protein